MRSFFSCLQASECEYVSSDRGIGFYLIKNLEARKAGLLYMPQQCIRFSPVSLRAFLLSRKCFPVSLGCPNSVYGEISSIPTELISNPVLKFLVEKELRSLKLAVSGCSVVSPQQSVSFSSNFPLIFNLFPLSDLD